MERRRPRGFQDPQAAPRPVSDVLDHWLAAHGLAELRTLSTIRERWGELVGADIARHSTPRSLRGGVLVVGVDHGGWATELRFQEHRIVGLLDECVGQGFVQRIDPRVDRPGSQSGVE